MASFIYFYSIHDVNTIEIFRARFVAVFRVLFWEFIHTRASHSYCGGRFSGVWLSYNGKTYVAYTHVYTIRVHAHRVYPLLTCATLVQKNIIFSEIIFLKKLNGIFAFFFTSSLHSDQLSILFSKHNLGNSFKYYFLTNYTFKSYNRLKFDSCNG